MYYRRSNERNDQRLKLVVLAPAREVQVRPLPSDDEASLSTIPPSLALTLPFAVALACPQAQQGEADSNGGGVSAEPLHIAPRGRQQQQQQQAAPPSYDPPAPLLPPLVPDGNGAASGVDAGEARSSGREPGRARDSGSGGAGGRGPKAAGGGGEAREHFAASTSADGGAGGDPSAAAVVVACLVRVSRAADGGVIRVLLFLPGGWVHCVWFGALVLASAPECVRACVCVRRGVGLGLGTYLRI